MNKNLIQLIISESATQLQVGAKPNTNILNPFLALELPYIPSAASFSLTIIGALKNQKSLFETRIILKNRDNDNIVVFDSGVQKIGNINEGVYENLNLNLNVDLKNVAIPEEGVYRALFILDGLEHYQDFYIRKFVKNDQ